MAGGNGGAFHRAVSELHWVSKLLVGAVVCFSLAEVQRQRAAWAAAEEPPSMPHPRLAQYQHAVAICRYMLLPLAALGSIALTTQMTFRPGVGLPKPGDTAAASTPVLLRLTFFLAAVFIAAGVTLAGTTVFFELHLSMTGVCMSPTVQATFYTTCTIAGASFAYWFFTVVRIGMRAE